jgi:hypothetical protein
VILSKEEKSGSRILMGKEEIKIPLKKYMS